MSGASVVLHQFPFSHFNEKARWGLDWKGVPHVRETYLPGPHAQQIQRLAGQTMTPVLVLDGEVIPGSARILDALERRFPSVRCSPRIRRCADARSRSRNASTARSGPPRERCCSRS